MSKFCQAYYCYTSGGSSKFHKISQSPIPFAWNPWGLSSCKGGGIQILGKFYYQRDTFLSRLPLQISETLSVFPIHSYSWAL